MGRGKRKGRGTREEKVREVVHVYADLLGNRGTEEPPGIMA